MPADPTPSVTEASTLRESRNALHTIVLATATLAELRESDTESHILRVHRYIRVLAQHLSQQPAWSQLRDQSTLETLCDCAPIYDLGSVGVPDRILLKPGRLSKEELRIMRTHPSVGFEALQRAEKTLGHPMPELALVKQVVLSHHERWDGSGYPQGLKGTQIPWSARIVAVADVYDALITDKVYKSGVSHERAVEIILSERGSHFDPDVVDAFGATQAQFQDISRKFADTDDDMQRKIEYLANAIAEQTEL